MYHDAWPHTGSTRAGARTPAAATTRIPSQVLAATLAESAVTPLLAVDLPIRGVVTGPVGSGKTAALAALRAELGERGMPMAEHPSSVADGEVLVVDDADALSDADLVALRRIVASPDAGVVVAHLPRPRGLLREIVAVLEKSAPPVLLGDVAPDRIAEATRIPIACSNAIVEQTGGLTWLTLAAVDAHDPGMCAVDPTHRTLAGALRGAVAHRLECLDDHHRALLEAMCVLPASELASQATGPVSLDEMVTDGCTAGLLAPNGAPPPIVRAAVRALTPAHRVPAGDAPHVGHESAWPEDAVSTPAALIARGDRIRGESPTQALALYRQAASLVADDADAALAIGIAAVGAGDLDAAGAAFDVLVRLPAHREHAAASDASTAVWAARGLLDVGAGSGPDGAQDAPARARRALVAVGMGRRPESATAQRASEAPDTLAVASDALTAALSASLSDQVVAAVDDLVVASEMYSATHADFPLVEPPAVVAAAAAVSIGRLDLAASTLDSARRRRQGGPAARARLVLWRAWVAIHAADPAAASALLDEAAASNAEPTPRDRLIRAACETALARRYAGTAELTHAFDGAARELHQQHVDLFLFPFLGELLLAAARVDDSGAVARHADAAFATLAQAGEPPLWSPLLYWSGIQRGIILGRPDALAPHAHALLDAAAHSPFAARLATAGRVWTDVLAGRVDVAAVQSAARDLAVHGLAWDGARLAAHGAARTEDRAVSAQLLACARDLHPVQGPRSPHPGDEPAELPQPGSVLSAREADVARLVLQGKTYIEIGQSLFISPRTAEHHIARIRRRVEATSRSDLLTKLRAMLGDDAGTRTTSHTQEGT
ncbi:helix-turn-helix transcriptional regulator [Microbacterium sp. EYE_5]|uniref:helix-turn-helix transcriptional regulator n=1 Tax=unclassified Microbacterium TaxID=2609290 RepID=UPI0020068315|nr:MULTISPECIES: helix-turn-helix transcriptional regulator [unclassified Microbacterium]MCK6079003.1 helix-turn-helix transcriptional regulator [Microbacterium sp. EYE_382]MCK6084273.1 helix-turn-helix transcriptional regulator [Microbacterium sp. EYE_384]MCK6123498.1 helix-turn-helix transcriptional regulator [Microbacterium sp. EYE_80]MCK6125037.1 helix-turn-helix transcriptional regulator [Microbacterium sp. EYE_79]MCK6142867.1 helix-turn-helix transcriptional regulator [Microbacterium sp.